VSCGGEQRVTGMREAAHVVWEQMHMGVSMGAAQHARAREKRWWIVKHVGKKKVMSLGAIRLVQPYRTSLIDLVCEVTRVRHACLTSWTIPTELVYEALESDPLVRWVRLVSFLYNIHPTYP
jgi:hypothetical protein